jgi:hypothetical protein
MGNANPTETEPGRDLDILSKRSRNVVLTLNCSDKAAHLDRKSISIEKGLIKS